MSAIVPNHFDDRGKLIIHITEMKLSCVVLWILLLYPAFINSVALYPRDNSGLSWIPFKTTKYSGNTTLTAAGNAIIQLFWLIDYTKNEIEFGVASNNGPTWLGIGISQSGGMKGADIAVGQLVSSVKHSSR